MHSGGFKLLDPTNAAVLSYVRTPPPGSNARALVVALNFTAQPQTVHLDLSAAGINSTSAKTLLGDAAELNTLTTLSTFTLPPYASLIAEVQ